MLNINICSGEIGSPAKTELAPHRASTSVFAGLHSFDRTTGHTVHFEHASTSSSVLQSDSFLMPQYGCISSYCTMGKCISPYCTGSTAVKYECLYGEMHFLILYYG